MKFGNLGGLGSGNMSKLKKRQSKVFALKDHHRISSQIKNVDVNLQGYEISLLKLPSRKPPPKNLIIQQAMKSNSHPT